MKIIFSTILLLLIIMINGFAQGKKPFPVRTGDYVYGIPLIGKNFPPGKTKLTDYKGKLVIIDFWTTGCPGCIRSFERMGELQREFNDQIQILLVNPWETAEKISQRMKRLKSYHLKAISNLPMIIGDSTWRKVFPHQTVPHHVLIGKDGKVLANTAGNSTTAENIRKILKDEKVFLVEKNDFNQPPKDRLRKALAQDNVWGAFEMYSAFSSYNPSVGAGEKSVTDTIGVSIKKTFSNLSIPEFFEIANPIPSRPVLFETKDAEHYLKARYDDDIWLSRNLFSYEIKLPAGYKSNLKRYILEDLNRYLMCTRSITAVVEKRTFTAYILEKKAKAVANLLSTNKKSKIQETKLFFKYKYQLPTILIASLVAHLDIDGQKRTILINQTGLNQDTFINFEIPKEKSNLERLKSALSKYGLTLRIEERILDALIVKDTNGLSEELSCVKCKK